MSTDRLAAALEAATGTAWAWSPAQCAYLGPGAWRLVEVSDDVYALRHAGGTVALYSPGAETYDAFYARSAADVAAKVGAL